MVRGEVVRVREMEFVEAAKALGYTPGRIIFRHILPNVMGPVIVIGAAISPRPSSWRRASASSGIGAQLPMVSWGGMIRAYYPTSPPASRIWRCFRAPASWECSRWLSCSWATGCAMRWTRGITGR